MLTHDSATYDSLRQLNLSQLTHLSREGNGPGTEAEEAIWHLAASERLLHDSVHDSGLQLKV
jgi:hypothetical protein